MPGNQEGDDLVADVRVVQPAVGLGVARLQHQVQQVHAGGGRGAALADHIVHQVAHVGDVRGALAVRAAHEAVLDRQPRELVHRLFQRADHRHDERV
ncbi:hypothetical protein D3C72_1804770 [compost metagenome]